MEKKTEPKSKGSNYASSIHEFLEDNEQLLQSLSKRNSETVEIEKSEEYEYEEDEEEVYEYTSGTAEFKFEKPKINQSPSQVSQASPKPDAKPNSSISKTPIQGKASPTSSKSINSPKSQNSRKLCRNSSLKNTKTLKNSKAYRTTQSMPPHMLEKQINNCDSYKSIHSLKSIPNTNEQRINQRSSDNVKNSLKNSSSNVSKSPNNIKSTDSLASSSDSYVQSLKSDDSTDIKKAKSSEPNGVSKEHLFTATSPEFILPKKQRKPKLKRESRSLATRAPDEFIQSRMKIMAERWKVANERKNTESLSMKSIDKCFMDGVKPYKMTGIKRQNIPEIDPTNYDHEEIDDNYVKPSPEMPMNPSQDFLEKSKIPVVERLTMNPKRKVTKIPKDKKKTADPKEFMDRQVAYENKHRFIKEQNSTHHNIIPKKKEGKIFQKLYQQSMMQQESDDDSQEETFDKSNAVWRMDPKWWQPKQDFRPQNQDPYNKENGDQYHDLRFSLESQKLTQSTKPFIERNSIDFQDALDAYRDRKAAKRHRKLYQEAIEDMC